MDFLKQDDKVHLSGFALMASTKVPLEMPGMRANSTTGRVRALHLVAFFGLEEAFHCLAALGQSRVLRFPTRKFKKQLSWNATAYEMSPLHSAVLGGDHKGLVKLLLEHGAAINKEDWQRRTPLALAAYYSRGEISILLKKNGGKAMVENTKETAFKLSMVYLSSFPRLM